MGRTLPLGKHGIAYNQDTFAHQGWEPPQDWHDLWRPELRHRLSVLAEPREVIGLTLKKLGQSYNPDEEEFQKVEADLVEQLQALNQQVKFYSSSAYLQPLILGDTDLAVGWSTDFLPLKDSYPEIKVVIPRSGTALWADIWVQPAVKQSAKEEDSLVKEWINFCWQEKSAQQIAIFTDAASPILLNLEKGNLPQDIVTNPLLWPGDKIISQSDSLLPLSSTVEQKFKSLWQNYTI